MNAKLIRIPQPPAGRRLRHANTLLSIPSALTTGSLVGESHARRLGLVDAALLAGQNDQLVVVQDGGEEVVVVVEGSDVGFVGLEGEGRTSG